MSCLLRRRGREQYDGQITDQHVDGDQLGTFAVGSVLGGCGRRSTGGGDTRGSVWFSDELLLGLLRRLRGDDDHGDGFDGR